MRNEERRRQLADAGLAVLAARGGRGLTHRAVDHWAEVPVGTTSNYFRSREDLLVALVTRIYERLAPSDEVAASLAKRSPDRALYADYLRDIVRRLTQQRELTLALFELRLEAARNPAIAAPVRGFLREQFHSDVAFVEAASLPGGSFEVALFHYALDGLLLDRLTTSIDPDTSTNAVIERLVAALFADPPRGVP